MRKTKIVCTIGPASSDRAVFADMCRAGMNVARLNFSHGTHEEQKAKLDMIRSVREEGRKGHLRSKSKAPVEPCGARVRVRPHRAA